MGLLNFAMPRGQLQHAVQAQGCRWPGASLGAAPPACIPLTGHYWQESVLEAEKHCSWPAALLCEWLRSGMRYTEILRNSFPPCKLGEEDFLCNV